jgi:hypothetical protein
MVSVRSRTWASGCFLTLVTVLAAGCGGHKAAEPPSPLAASDGVAAGGAGVRGSYPTTLTADYTPNRNFGLAFVIKNRSDQPVTIVRLSSNDETEKRFARLVGASAAAYVPIDCDGHSCPATDLGLGSPPYEALPPLAPLTIHAHKQASIQLHFRWVLCLDAPIQTSDRENTTLIVAYRTGGKTASQLLQARQAQLEVSATSACASPASS